MVRVVWGQEGVGDKRVLGFGGCGVNNFVKDLNDCTYCEIEYMASKIIPDNKTFKMDSLLPEI